MNMVYNGGNMEEEKLENTSLKQEYKPERNPDGTIKPGFSGNLNGKPKGAKSMTTRVREALEEYATEQGESKKTYYQQLIKTVLEKALVDKDPQMIKLMWNYMDGMPAQSVDLTSGNEKLPTPILGFITTNAIPINDSDAKNKVNAEADTSDSGRNIGEQNSVSPSLLDSLGTVG